MYHAKKHPESRFSSVILSCLLLLSAGCRDVKQELLNSSYCRCMTEEMKQANCSIPFQFGHELWFGIAEGKKEDEILFSGLTCLYSKPQGISRTKCGIRKILADKSEESPFAKGDMLLFPVYHGLKNTHRIDLSRTVRIDTSGGSVHLIPLLRDPPLRFTRIPESELKNTGKSVMGRRKEQLRKAFERAGMEGTWEIGDSGQMLLLFNCTEKKLFLPFLSMEQPLTITIPQKNGFLFSLSPPLDYPPALYWGNSLSAEPFLEWKRIKGFRFLAAGGKNLQTWQRWDFECGQLLQWEDVLPRILEVLRNCPPQAE